MKKLLAALLLITIQNSYGQDCKTQAANKLSESVRFQDVYARSNEDPKANISIAKLKPPLTIAENWIKGILKNSTGAKLAYSNDYFFDYASGFTKDFYKATGIKGCYSSRMRFYAYYCYDDRNEVFTEDESGSYAAVNFNNVFASTLCTDVGVFTVNGKLAFKMFEKSRTEGRIDYYEQVAMSNVYDTIYKSKHDFIIIRNSDQPIFLPIPRKEYLQQLLKDVEDYKNREVATAKLAYTPAAEAANKASLDDQLKRIDNSKTSTPEQMAPYRKRLIENWETEKQKFEKRMARTETDAAKSKEVLLEYLNRPQEWLNKSFQQFYSYSSFTGRGVREYLEKLDVFTYSGEEETRTFIASINPAYFNKSLSADVPQLIMVDLPKGSYPHMKKVADLVKKPGALAPLENILNKGKSPVEQPILVSGSTYKLSYLPKLNKLTPLIVPADMKPSMGSTMPVNNPPINKFNFEIPALSPKLKQLPPQPFTADAYKNYVTDLHTQIASALKPEIKKKTDGYVKQKKLTQSKAISNAALAAWLQKTPAASLYLYSMAVVSNLSDGLAANNFSAFLIMGGLPEKSIPVLEYWNKQNPGKATILANLGNAYYRLGDITTAMKYLQQCVQKDSLNSVANKLLCMVYLKKGDVAKAEEHGTRSISKSHDQQIISILQQLNNKIKPGTVMSRFPPLPEKEFPMLEQIKLPAMPTRLDDMDQFAIELDAAKASLKMTIAAIDAKWPKQNGDMQQEVLKATLTKGISPIQIKAQYIIMDGMQIYQSESVKEDDVFQYQLKKINAPHNITIKAIHTKYNSRLKKLEGGEAGDEDQIAALEKAKCMELNGQTEVYLARLSRLVNQYASRQEYISRKFYRDCANWVPYWFSASGFDFPSIERDYLTDVLNILGEYKVFTKMHCELFEPLPIKEGEVQEWEDEYCANFKGKIGVGLGKVFWSCNSVGLEAGEGIVGGFEANYADDGSFEDVSFELGFGVDWKIGTEHIAQIGVGASVKEFVKIGPDKITGDWGVTDAGVKGEIAIERENGNVSVEVKVIEVTAGYNTGVNTEGIAVPILNLK